MSRASWSRRYLIGMWTLFRPGRELEHFVDVAMDRFCAVAVERGMAADGEQPVAERAENDSVTCGRHGRQSIPIVQRRIEHYNVPEDRIQVTVAQLATGNVN